MKSLSKTLAISTVVCSSIFGAIAAHAETQAPKAVEQIDINKYTGKWYEIAHLPVYFQRKCASDTSATYALKADKTVAVINSCRTQSGEMIRSEGVAYPQNAGNSKLKVSFLPKGLRWIPFTKGDYWVLRIDPDYQTVLVGGPSHKYLWILSRNPQLDTTTYQSYLQTARDYGYDVTKLVKTPQK